MTPRLLIAAPSSGSGKTTLSMILCAALRTRGLSIQACKVGPDYIDPSHLSHASGQPAHNLDSFFLDEDALKTYFADVSQAADVVIVEGVMGLFDGRDSLGKEASSAHLAKLLGLPVILVIDASAMAGSIAALAQGFKTFDAELKVAGVIANRVGSERHADILQAALNAVGIPLLGFVKRDAALELPSRHLGLHLAHEKRLDLMRLRAASRHIDLDTLLDLAEQAPPLAASPPVAPALSAKRVRIGVARDEAFCFYYEENLKALERAGAELCFFSPLHDHVLPDHIGGIYLGGGYPELFAAQLSQNEAMRRALHDFGGMIYAECGGRMVLSQALLYENKRYPMVGRIPGDTVMPTPSRLILGYRHLKALKDSPVVKMGMALKGHEFHYSRHTGIEDDLFQSFGSDQQEGYADTHVHASYVHLYFPATPELAPRFIATAFHSQQATQ